MLGFLSWFLIVVSLFCLIPFKPHPAPSGGCLKKQTYQFHLFNRIKSTSLFQPSGLFFLVCVYPFVTLHRFIVLIQVPHQTAATARISIPNIFNSRSHFQIIGHVHRSSNKNVLWTGFFYHIPPMQFLYITYFFSLCFNNVQKILQVSKKSVLFRSWNFLNRWTLIMYLSFDRLRFTN